MPPEALQQYKVGCYQHYSKNVLASMTPQDPPRLQQGSQTAAPPAAAARSAGTASSDMMHRAARGTVDTMEFNGKPDIGH